MPHDGLLDESPSRWQSGRRQLAQGLAVTRAPFTSAASEQPFKPEVLTDYEVGVKANDLLDGNLSFDADYFYGDYSNIQRLSSETGAIVNAQVVLNAAKATIQGIETQFDYVALPHLTFSGYANWTDWVYNSWPLPNTGVNLAGIPGWLAPKWMMRLAAKYDVPFQTGLLSFNLGWNYQSAEQLYITPFVGSTQGAYSLVDARISYTAESWEFAVQGTNLTGAHYYAAGQLGNQPNPLNGSISPVETGEVTPGTPRVVMATLTYHIGQ